MPDELNEHAPAGSTTLDPTLETPEPAALVKILPAGRTLYETSTPSFYANDAELFGTGTELTLTFSHASGEREEDGSAKLTARAEVIIPWPFVPQLISCLQEIFGQYVKGKT